MRYCLLGAVSALLSVSTGLAQSTFGSITGTVKDPSGSIVPGATVEVTNEATGVTRQSVSSSAGVFNVPNLDIGSYRVRVSGAGFTTYERSGVQLAANQVFNLDVQLTVGATTTVVEVQGVSTVIATETTDISGSVGRQSVESLPFVSRQKGDGGVYAFATLTTGAAAVPGSSTPIFQGTRSQVGILPTMDGIAVMAYPQGASPVQPSLEAVQELKMETSVAPAEFSTAGNFQVVTRSGSNDFHGGAFWGYNSSSLNARNFFSAQVPFRVYNGFGAFGGGAIKKNKLFFFADYEGSREAATITLLQNVPLVPWKSGILTTGVTRQLVDPTNGQPFAGNVIPAGRISKVSQAIQSYAFPDPNNGAPNALANNWTVNRPGTTGFTRFNHFDGRGDYNATSKDLIFARYSWRRMPLQVPAVFPLYRIQTRYAQSSVLAWNHTISPSAFNEFRFGTTYHRNFYTADVIGSDLLQRFGIVGVPTTGVKTAPYFNITGTPWSPDANSANFQDNPQTTLEWIDNLSWNRGRHFMKFGFDAVRDRFNGNNIAANVYGQYDFTGTYTGFSYADFLLGIPQTTTLALPSPNRHLRGTTWGIYAQDQFKVSSSLTINYGARWELEQPYTDTKGSLYTWNPATNGLVVMDDGLKLVNPFYPKNISITTASQAGYPSKLVSMNQHQFEPRVGFAYKPFGSDKTVIRGGYGIYSNLIYATLARSHLTGGPFAGSVTYTNAVSGGVPLFSFPSPFLTSGTTSVQNVNAVNPDLTTPYTQQWNFTIERQVASFGLRASYVGSRSVRLIYRRNLNLPLPSTIPFTTSRRPDQLFNQIIYADNGGTDAYHSLELSAQKRYGHNLTFSSGFTWAKDLTDTQDSGGGGTTFAGQVIQNPFGRAVEKANNGLVVPHRFFLYGVYTLPVGKGQRWLSSGGVADAVLGGWRLTGTVVSQSGQYFQPSFSGPDPSGTGTFGGVPDRIADGNLSEGRSVGRWFDPQAFAIPGCPPTNRVCTNPAPVGRFGNSGFNILQGPPIRNLDLGLQKEFHYRERWQLRLMLTAVNALNHPSFSNPSANISSPGTVAVISGQTRPLIGEPGPREVDFGLRLTF